MAIVVSLEHLAILNNNSKAKILAVTLDNAIEILLKNGKSPSRDVGKLDNRGSHFYLALYWSLELSNQNEDESLKIEFGKIASELQKREDDIISELNNAQGESVDLKGYYFPDIIKTSHVMRPSKILNNIIDSF